MTRGLPALLPLVLLAGCGAPSPREAPVAEATSAAVRAERRAYDGAPPVIPHERFSRSCDACHDGQAVAVPGVGVAPVAPHETTVGMRAGARCTQCHVEQRTRGEFRVSRFEGRPQRVRHRAAATPGAPPVTPHPVFMRESCLACHTGPAARPQIRTTHPERTRCRQCHVEQHAATTLRGLAG